MTQHARIKGIEARAQVERHGRITFFPRIGDSE